MARGRDHADAAHDLPLAVHEIEPVLGRDWREVVREIAGRRPLVRVRRVDVFPALHHVAGIREREAWLAPALDERVAAAVVEVEVRIDHDPDVFRP